MHLFAHKRVQNTTTLKVEHEQAAYNQIAFHFSLVNEIVKND